MFSSFFDLNFKTLNKAKRNYHRFYVRCRRFDFSNGSSMPSSCNCEVDTRPEALMRMTFESRGGRDAVPFWFPCDLVRECWAWLR